jgi:hypothetical protein
VNTDYIPAHIQPLAVSVGTGATTAIAVLNADMDSSGNINVFSLAAGTTQLSVSGLCALN